jgi:hypothetical protein
MLILARRRFDPRSVSLHESEDSSFPMAVLADDPTGHRQSLADILERKIGLPVEELLSGPEGGDTSPPPI